MLMLGYQRSQKINLSIADLSDCQITRIPDEIFDLVSDAKLKSCDLSNNVIRKLPPKFSIEFSLLTGKFSMITTEFPYKSNERNFQTDLNLANNEIYKLPDEFTSLTLLVRLDISNNYLLNLPAVLFKLPKLRQLKAHHNAIIGMSCGSKKAYTVNILHCNVRIVYNCYNFRLKFLILFFLFSQTSTVTK